VSRLLRLRYYVDGINSRQAAVTCSSDMDLKKRKGVSVRRHVADTAGFGAEKRGWLAQRATYLSGDLADAY